ncbi:MAG: hypothetical protein H0Z19_05295 [Archaeoglobus sp.]|uniref:hypothetical protein n=1 Tax=Archaeoglobus sp. TaxID=1872626 RepID=UPI001D5A3BC7|nr:hypothetical protein [Archaeoglobus sp.]MBO8179883.1 hypothetical protein [Archaeoglobus sp.]
MYAVRREEFKRDERAFSANQIVGFMTVIGAIIGALILLKFGTGIYYTVGDTLPTPSDPNASEVMQNVDNTAKTVFTTAPLAPYAWVIGIIMTALFGAFLIFRD